MERSESIVDEEGGAAELLLALASLTNERERDADRRGPGRPADRLADSPRKRRRTAGSNPRFADYVLLNELPAGLLNGQSFEAVHVGAQWRAAAEAQQRSLDRAHTFSSDEGGGSSGSERAPEARGGGGGGGLSAGALQRQWDKEWAALTTWIRMNLHNPRTPKKQILFLGRQDPRTDAWAFELNPNLTWADVSGETKARLKTLPEETATTYGRKYPRADPGDWEKRPQRYMLPGGADVAFIPLGELVYSLQAIYTRHELGFAQPRAAPSARPTTAATGAGAGAAAAAAELREYWREQLHQRRRAQQGAEEQRQPPLHAAAAKQMPVAPGEAATAACEQSEMPATAPTAPAGVAAPAAPTQLPASVDPRPALAPMLAAAAAPLARQQQVPAGAPHAVWLAPCVPFVAIGVPVMPAQPC